MYTQIRIWQRFGLRANFGKFFLPVPLAASTRLGGFLALKRPLVAENSSAHRAIVFQDSRNST